MLTGTLMTSVGAKHVKSKGSSKTSAMSGQAGQLKSTPFHFEDGTTGKGQDYAKLEGIRSGRKSLKGRSARLSITLPNQGRTVLATALGMPKQRHLQQVERTTDMAIKLASTRKTLLVIYLLRSGCMQQTMHLRSPSRAIRW